MVSSNIILSELHVTNSRRRYCGVDGTWARERERARTYATFGRFFTFANYKFYAVHIHFFLRYRQQLVCATTHECLTRCKVNKPEKYEKYPQPNESEMSGGYLIFTTWALREMAKPKWECRQQLAINSDEEKKKLTTKLPSERRTMSIRTGVKFAVEPINGMFVMWENM